ncbi:DUF4097 family beta strand repeat-containing protein [Actinoplanes sp. NPDC026623]|uniref:DUF4097 family beta strand repeat-containing protein n=1 Tax=Actinoplanes sp. NPDC026623 TaxID=3155610 RepID=UPI0033E70B37
MQTFATPAPISAVLNIPAGRVRFIAADRADATVEILPADAAKTRDVTAAQHTTVEYGDGVLRITGTIPAKNRILGNAGVVEITVQLPAGSHLQAKTATAELRGVGRLGDVTYDSAHGTVKLDETAGLHLTIAAGDVHVGRLGGPAQISTQQGDITITEATDGAVELSTQAGDITIGAAPGVSASLNAGTGYGRIDNALRNTGTPGLTIHATAAYGDITARSL